MATNVLRRMSVAFGVVLKVILYGLCLLSVLVIAISFVEMRLPGLAFVVIPLFIAGGILMFTSYGYLLLRGNRVLATQGRGFGRYFVQSARAQPVWLMVVHVALFGTAVAAIASSYVLGVANSTFTSSSGNYFVETRGVTEQITSAAFARGITTSQVISPIGFALLVFTLTLMFLWGDQRMNVPNVGTVADEITSKEAVDSARRETGSIGGT